MLWKALLVLLFVAANGFFVAAEFALVKVRLSEIRVLSRAGSRTARLVERILGRLDAYLSACQLGVTVVSLVLGWVGEPWVAEMLEPLLGTFGIPQDKVHFLAFPIALSIITFLHITAGEQAPKILAIQKHQPMARAVGVPLFLFYRVFQPFIWLLNTSSNLILKAIGIRLDTAHGETLTDDELRNILLDSVGWIHVTPRERLIMANVLDLERKVAGRYMVPRSHIIYLNMEDSIEEKLRKAAESGRTRLPLCDGDLDRVIGIVHVKDILQAITSQEEITALVGVAREVLFLPELITLDALLSEFQRKRMPLALLVDEYGVLSGMITIEDVLEELVGPIQDEFDGVLPDILEREPGRFEVDAVCPVHDVAKKCRMVLPEDTEAATIGGVVIDLLGHIPAAGEKVALGPHRITVLEAEPTKIQRILIERAKPEGGENRE